MTPSPTSMLKPSTLGLALCLALGFVGCKSETEAPPKGEPLPEAQALTPVSIALNWYAEPEFGGIYAAQVHGFFKDEGLDVTIQPGGPGSPVVPQVATKKVTFGVVTADEVALGRGKGADIVTIFGTFQTHPQGIMVHKERGVDGLENLTGGTLALEVGPPFTLHLKKTFPFKGVDIVPYDGSVARFLVEKDYAQQVYLTSEPFIAKEQGASPQVFLVAETGYNPYANAIITHGDNIEGEQDTLRHFVGAVSKGWYQYLKDPSETNALIAKLNPTMDKGALAYSADAQKALITGGKAESEGIGTMELARWQALLGQLEGLGLIEPGAKAEAHFTTSFVPKPPGGTN